MAESVCEPVRICEFDPYILKILIIILIRLFFVIRGNTKFPSFSRFQCVQKDPTNISIFKQINFRMQMCVCFSVLPHFCVSANITMDACAAFTQPASFSLSLTNLSVHPFILASPQILVATPLRQLLSQFLADCKKIVSPNLIKYSQRKFNHHKISNVWQAREEMHAYIDGRGWWSNILSGLTNQYGQNKNCRISCLFKNKRFKKQFPFFFC